MHDYTMSRAWAQLGGSFSTPNIKTSTPKFSILFFYNVCKIFVLIINNLRALTSKIDILSKYYKWKFQIRLLL